MIAYPESKEELKLYLDFIGNKCLYLNFSYTSKQKSVGYTTNIEIIIWHQKFPKTEKKYFVTWKLFLNWIFFFYKMFR